MASTQDGATGKGILVYGCTGFSGQLIAKEAAKRGVAVTLAGRSLEKVREVAKSNGVPEESTMAFALRYVTHGRPPPPPHPPS